MKPKAYKLQNQLSAQMWCFYWDLSSLIMWVQHINYLLQIAAFTQNRAVVKRPQLWNLRELLFDHALHDSYVFSRRESKSTPWKKRLWINYIGLLGKLGFRNICFCSCSLFLFFYRADTTDPSSVRLLVHSGRLVELAEEEINLFLVL